MGPTRRIRLPLPWAPGLLVLLVALFVEGCLVLPIPTNRMATTSRRNVKPDTINEILVGQTTRAEMVLKLGEPDQWTTDFSRYRYHWERVKWDIIILVGSQGGGYAGDAEINKNHDLVIDFDPTGVVSHREFTSRFEGSEEKQPQPRGTPR